MPGRNNVEEVESATSTHHHFRNNLLSMTLFLFALCVTILTIKYTVTGMSADALAVLNATVSGGFGYVGAAIGPFLRAFESGKPGPETLALEISPLMPNMATIQASVEKGLNDMMLVMDMIPHDGLFEFGLPFSDGPASILATTNAEFDESMSDHLHRERQALRQLLVAVEWSPATRFLPSNPHAGWFAPIARRFNDQPRKEMLARFDGLIHVLEDAKTVRRRWIKRLSYEGQFMKAVIELKKTSCHSASGLGSSWTELIGTGNRGWLMSTMDSHEFVALTHVLEATQPHMDILCKMVHEGGKSISRVRDMLTEDLSFIDDTMRKLADQRRELAGLARGQFKREVVMEAEVGLLKSRAERWFKRTSKYLVKK
ncbi:hypothetical protein BKA56DRAFT_656121 [Ilyonectria sp. MPI-CAGE-AT-0026]|nr:hypothetical protein BKA56DRAFT_656121 [Ilyonectria sp. MPI-CAGE-AT-0026]